MKKLTIAILGICFLAVLSAEAQTADVKIKDIPANGQDDEGTIIDIHKKTKMDAKMEWQITEGTDEINGDAAPLLKEARGNWKKACEDWKKAVELGNKDAVSALKDFCK